MADISSTWRRKFPEGFLSEERSASEERERVIQRLPGSVQAMLLRANRTLTDAEVQKLSHARADRRCEALRMIFEGKSADDAITFLIGGDAPATPPSPSPRPASVAPEKEAAVVRRVHPPPPSLQSTVMTHLYGDSDGDEGDATSSTHVRSPCLPPQPAPERPLNDIRVNTSSNLQALLKGVKGKDGGKPVATAKKSTATDPVDYRQQLYKDSISNVSAGEKKETSEKKNTDLVKDLPLHKYPKSTFCSAWDEHFNTFIVHPNQLKRLEKLEKQMSPPAVVRPRTHGNFTRMKTDEYRRLVNQQTSPEKIPSTVLQSESLGKESVEIGKGCPQLMSRTRSTRHSNGNNEAQVSSSPFVPPLKITKSKKRKEDVFTRLYTGHSYWGSPRANTARGKASKSFTHDSALSNGTHFQRSLSGQVGRTPRLRGEGGNTPTRWLTPCRSATPRGFRRIPTSSKPFSSRGQGGGGGGMVKESGMSQKKSPKTVPLSRQYTLQQLQRAATRTGNEARFVRTSTWSARHGPCGGYYSEYMQGGQCCGRNKSRFEIGDWQKFSVTPKTCR